MTSSPIADLNDSLLPWASTTEAQLASQFKNVRLFVEIDITGDELERLTRFYGTFLSRQISEGSTAEALLEACPALTVSTLLARAAQLNEISELPSEYWFGLGIEPTAERIALIDGRYKELLAAAGLDPMDAAAEGADGELGRVFAHVGIATDWTPELIELIDTRRADGTAEEDSADEAAAVVSELAGQDTQIGPLCATAPDIARDLITPIVNLVRHAAEYPDTWEYTLSAKYRGERDTVVSLPALIAEDVEAELRERPAGTVNRRHSVGIAHRQAQPRLRLDVARKRVVLRLPSQPLTAAAAGATATGAAVAGAAARETEAAGAAAEIRWRVDFDGQPGAFRASRSDNPSRSESEVVDIPVRQPYRELHVSNGLYGANPAARVDQFWQMSMIESADPVLVFSLRGQNLTRRVSLHHSQVYVITPQDYVAKDLVQGTDVPVLDEQPMKTWDGWVIRELDLTDSLSLHLMAPGAHSPSMSAVRSIDNRQRVRFIEPDAPAGATDTRAATGLFTVTGKPIFDQSLMVEFPPTISGGTEIWYMSISAYAGPGEVGEPVSDEEPLEVPAEGGSFEVFDPDLWDSPWVGEYLVRLRGPRNESFRHEYALIEGIEVETEIEGSSSQTRLPVVAGLSPVTVRLRPGAKPFEKIAPLNLGPEDTYATVAVTTDAGDSLPVIVRPPMIRYQLPLIGEEPMWRTEAMVVESGWLDTARKFRVRPGAAIEDPRLVIRNNHGAPVRTLALNTVDGITWSADMKPAAPSLSVLSRGSCELEFVDPAARKRVSVRLVRVEPSAAIEAELNGRDLVLNCDEPSRLSGMAAWVWPTTAPWEAARALPIRIESGQPRTQLPEELVEAGPLSVQLFHTDRFNLLRPASAPGDRAFQLRQPGYFGRSPELTQEQNRQEPGAEVAPGVEWKEPWRRLSAFLAGESEKAPSDQSVLSTLWDVQAGWLSGRFDVVDKLRAALSANPRESIHAMSRSLVPAADRPAQFIASGLVHSPIISGDTAGTRAAGEDITYRRADSPWIAALEILGELSRIDEDAEPARGLRRQLRDVAGAPLVTTLETGRDNSLDTACIDSTTVQIAHMDPAQQKAVLDMFFGGAGVVPGALSEENSRLIAVFDTFKHREELSELLADPLLMTTAVKVLRRVKQANRQLYLSARVRFDRLDGVDMDSPANRWALAPMISMIFSLATRMHAHGYLQSLGALAQAYDGWAQMARLVPDLVTGDLVSADAMVLGVFGPRVDQTAP